RKFIKQDCFTAQIKNGKTIKKGKGIDLPFALSVPQMASKSHSASILRRTQFFSPYFFLNFSTRPAESKSFCFPVKKGWQLEQISTWILPTVERVSTTHPQAHVIVAFLYSGWIPAFMISSLVPEFYNIRKIALQSVLRPRNHCKHVVFSQSGPRPARYLRGGCLLFNLPISREATKLRT